MAISGIQHYRYKKLHERLNSISEFSLSEEQLTDVKNHLETLNDLYGSYKQLLDDVMLTINDFDKHELKIRQLISKHKKKIKIISQNITVDRSMF